jgi:hypothetical protein
MCSDLRAELCTGWRLPVVCPDDRRRFDDDINAGHRPAVAWTADLTCADRN